LFWFASSLSAFQTAESTFELTLIAGVQFPRQAVASYVMRTVDSVRGHRFVQERICG